MQHEPTNAELALGLSNLGNRLEKLDQTNGELLQAITDLTLFVKEQFLYINNTLVDHTRRLVSLEVRMGNVEESLQIMEQAIDAALEQLVNHEGRIALLERGIVI